MVHKGGRLRSEASTAEATVSCVWHRTGSYVPLHRDTLLKVITQEMVRCLQQKIK